MFQPDKILKKLTPVIQAFDDISLSDSLKNYDKLACPNARRIRAAKIIHDIIDLCSEDIFQFDNRKMFVFKHTFRSNDCTMSIKDNSIQFLSTRMLTLEPADIIHLDFVLHTRTAILHEVIQNDKLPIVAAPNILSDIALSILGPPSLMHLTKSSQSNQEHCCFLWPSQKFIQYWQYMMMNLK